MLLDSLTREREPKLDAKRKIVSDARHEQNLRFTNYYIMYLSKIHRSEQVRAETDFSLCEGAFASRESDL